MFFILLSLILTKDIYTNIVGELLVDLMLIFNCHYFAGINNLESKYFLAPVRFIPQTLLTDSNVSPSKNRKKNDIKQTKINCMF